MLYFFKYQNIFYPIYKQKVALLKNDNKKLTKNDPEGYFSSGPNLIVLIVILSYDNLGNFFALTTDIETASGILDAHALKIEEFNRSIVAYADTVNSGSFGGEHHTAETKISGADIVHTHHCVGLGNEHVTSDSTVLSTAFRVVFHFDGLEKSLAFADGTGECLGIHN